MVVVSPSETLKIDYEGQNSAIFKNRTLKIAQDIARRYNISGAEIRIQDQGALEVAIAARIETAFERALGGES